MYIRELLEIIARAYPEWLPYFSRPLTDEENTQLDEALRQGWVIRSPAGAWKITKEGLAAIPKLNEREPEELAAIEKRKAAEREKAAQEKAAQDNPPSD